MTTVISQNCLRFVRHFGAALVAIEFSIVDFLRVQFFIDGGV